MHFQHFSVEPPLRLRPEQIEGDGFGENLRIVQFRRTRVELYAAATVCKRHGSGNAGEARHFPDGVGGQVEINKNTLGIGGLEVPLGGE